MKPKIGIVDVGGGYRGIYAAGVLDYCMHKGIWFDFLSFHTFVFQTYAFHFNRTV